LKSAGGFELDLACSVSDETNNKAEAAMDIYFNRFFHHLVSGKEVD